MEPAFLQVGDAGLAALGALTALTRLSLSGCVAASSPAIAALAQSLPSLQVLHLGGTSRVATVTDEVQPEVHVSASLESWWHRLYCHNMDRQTPG